MLFSTGLMAQVPAEENRLNELSKMGKINLTEIFLTNVENLFISAPNEPLIDSEQNMPDNKFLRKRWKAINKSGYRHIMTLRKNYADILPYADKKDLVNAIMYLESVNKKLVSN